jgi:hypothetical protein
MRDFFGRAAHALFCQLGSVEPAKKSTVARVNGFPPRAVGDDIERDMPTALCRTVGTRNCKDHGVVLLSDESGEQKPEGCAESACEKDINGAGAHGVRLQC